MIAAKKFSRRVKIVHDEAQIEMLEAVFSMNARINELAGSVSEGEWAKTNEKLFSSLKKTIVKLRTPNQENWPGLAREVGDSIDAMMSTMDPTVDDNSEAIEDLIHGLESWAVAADRMLLSTAVLYRAKYSGEGSNTRRRRLAWVLREMRSTNCPEQVDRAKNVYRKFRYESITLATSSASRSDSESHIDPTITANYSQHLRVGRPMTGTPVVYTNVTQEDNRVMGYVDEFRAFKKYLNNRQMSSREKSKKINAWLKARNLKHPPTRFAPSMSDLIDQIDFTDSKSTTVNQQYGIRSRVINTGVFLTTGGTSVIHPLANYWKKPIGFREAKSWYRWWRYV